MFSIFLLYIYIYIHKKLGLINLVVKSICIKGYCILVKKKGPSSYGVEVKRGQRPKLLLFSSPGHRPCELLSWVSVRPLAFHI